MGALPPHIFSIASQSYQRLRRSIRVENNKIHRQTILVSGESGAGKTETSKLLLMFLSTLAFSTTTDKAISRNNTFINKLDSCNPILEAFGNAATSHNHNSSRFGKFLQLHFDDASSIVGLQLRTYLLEKARVTYQDVGELNYHIFYQLCVAAANGETDKRG